MPISWGKKRKNQSCMGKEKEKPELQLVKERETTKKKKERAVAEPHYTSKKPPKISNAFRFVVLKKMCFRWRKYFLKNC